MNKEEMQRYLNQQAEEGKEELEALRNFIKILGITFPQKSENSDN